MEDTGILSVFGILLQILLPLLGVAILAAIVVGVFQVVTQIQDPVIGFAGRVFAIGLFLYAGTEFLSSTVVGFAARIWSGADFYH